MLEALGTAAVTAAASGADSGAGIVHCSESAVQSTRCFEAALLTRFRGTCLDLYSWKAAEHAPDLAPGHTMCCRCR